MKKKAILIILILTCFSIFSLFANSETKHNNDIMHRMMLLVIQIGVIIFAAKIGNMIFEKFVRGETPPSEIGFGLGLSFAKEVVAGHGGEVFAENRENGGACFTVVLPKSSHVYKRPYSRDS